MMLHGFAGPVAAGVRLLRPSDESRRVGRSPGFHALMVGPVAARADAGHGAVTLVPYPSDPRPGVLDVPAGSALLEVRADLLHAACGATGVVGLRRAEGERNPKLEALSRRIVELHVASPVRDSVLEALWIALARTIGFQFGGMSLRPSDAWMNPGALQRVVELVDAELAGGLPSARLAEAAGLGASAFLRAFRGSMGMTPCDYVLRRRVRLAADLLELTDLPVAVIAERTGFGSGTHLASAFLSLRGLSPSAHRRALRTVARPGAR